MRAALQQSVEAAFDERDLGVSELPGELGKTMNFLIQTWPGQVVQANTSALRLDRLAEYLSAEGARRYFGVPAGARIDAGQARALADQLLEETLGDFHRPRSHPPGYGGYLRAVFLRNRRLADRTFLSLVRELGTFWGTLAGVKGYSNGESFVSRNIGLRAAWSGAAWRVGLRFMDQDDLHVADPRQQGLSPERLLRGLLLDQEFVTGRSGPLNPRGSWFALQRLYRVAPAVQAAGGRALREARDAAVRKTRAALRRDLFLRDHFSPPFLEASLECDRLWEACTRARLRLSDEAAVERFLKDFFPGAAAEAGIKRHAKALRESAGHFFLNPDA